jgi:hypothetical protein
MHLLPTHPRDGIDAARQTWHGRLLRLAGPAEALSKEGLDRPQAATNVANRELDTGAPATIAAGDRCPARRGRRERRVEQSALQRIEVRGRQLRERGPDPGWVRSGPVATCLHERWRNPFRLEPLDAHRPPLPWSVARMVAAQHALRAPLLGERLVPLAEARGLGGCERAAGLAVTARSRTTRDGHHPQYRARVRARGSALSSRRRADRLRAYVRACAREAPTDVDVAPVRC